MISLKKYLFLIFLFSSIFASSQSEEETRANMINGLVNYRHDVIAGDESKTKTLSQLNYLWKDADEHISYEIVDLLFNVVYARTVLGMDSVKISKNIEKHAPNYIGIGKKVLSDIDLIIDNQDLIDLLSGQFLKPDPPFQIDSKSDIFEEMSFYKIQKNMKISEIGAGAGTWSCIAGMTFDSLDIYINEIDNTKIELAKHKISNSDLIRPANRFHYILGHAKSTGMEGYNLDRIIIRNSFHHFSKKKIMLAAIKNSLAPDGSLYIFDPITFPGKENTGCQKKMSQRKIRKAILKGGFEIAEERTSKNWKWIMLHCKPIQK